MTAAPPARMISPAQRRALFAAANTRGLSIDDLRALTPAGSISMLTRDQAYDMLRRLNSGSRFDTPPPARRPRAARGVIRLVSDAQREKIAALRMQLGWTEQGLHDFLAERHFAHDRLRAMTEMQTAWDAHQVIELLKHVLARTTAAAERLASATERQPPATSHYSEVATDGVTCPY